METAVPPAWYCSTFGKVQEYLQHGTAVFCREYCSFDRLRINLFDRLRIKMGLGWGFFASPLPHGEGVRG